MSTTTPGALGALLAERCPRCRRGRMFRGWFAMNDTCPTCGLLFQREEGYFLGAMYFSSALTAVFITVFYFTTAALFPNLGNLATVLAALVPFLPLVPWVFRFSRVLWTWFDRALCPADEAGAFEHFRHKELQAERGAGSEPASAPGGTP